MAQAVGETILKWLATTQWPMTGTPLDALATVTYSALLNELDLTTLTPDGIVDLLISAKVVTGAGALGSNPFCAVFAAGRADGTNYPDNLNYNRVGQGIVVAAVSTTYYGPKYSLAAAFGGVLPRYVKPALFNRTGATLGNGSLLYYEPVYPMTKLS